MSVLEIPDAENDIELTPDEQPEPVQTEGERVYDERANVPVTVVAERFLRAILLAVPLDRIEELHLFSPLRQGTAETGIAVIAARVVVPDEEVAPAPVLELALEQHDAPAAAERDMEADAELVDEAERRTDDDADAADADAGAEAHAEESKDDVGEAPERMTAGDHDDSPYADVPVSHATESTVPLPETAPPSPVPRVRHTVYTARYRLVIKGPERGRWEMDVVDEADAPLLTVETVVRGVQRRAGEDTATVRYDAHQLVRALRIVPIVDPAVTPTGAPTGEPNASPDATLNGAV